MNYFTFKLFNELLHQSHFFQIIIIYNFFFSFDLFPSIFKDFYALVSLDFHYKVPPKKS